MNVWLCWGLNDFLSFFVYYFGLLGDVLSVCVSVVCISCVCVCVMCGCGDRVVSFISRWRWCCLRFCYDGWLVGWEKMWVRFICSVDGHTSSLRHTVRDRRGAAAHISTTTHTLMLYREVEHTIQSLYIFMESQLGIQTHTHRACMCSWGVVVGFRPYFTLDHINVCSV